MKLIEARWVSAEAVDSNLSVIDIFVPNEITGTSLVHGVPKLAHVTGLTSTSTVLCTVDPIVIIGILQGDTTLYTL